jgi:hypothetical protein
MNLQAIIVIGLILAAVLYAASTLYKKRRAFSTKAGCAEDCGCGGTSKKLPS